MTRRSPSRRQETRFALGRSFGRCLFVALLHTSLIPTWAWPQTINFIQSNGEVSSRTIIQSNNASHSINGLTSGGRAASSTAASFSGDFSSIVLEQTGSGAQSFGAKIAVSDTSDVSFKMQTTAASSLVVNVIAGTYVSDVSMSGSGAKTVNLLVNAPDKAVTQDIDLSGGKVNLRVTQTNSASLVLDYAASGNFRDTVEINQTGLNTAVDIAGTSRGAASLMLRMAGDDSSAYIDATLGFASSLSYSVFRDGVSLGSEASPVSITVSDYGTVSVTVND